MLRREVKMATGGTHDNHIAKLVGLSDPMKVEALQKATYLAVDATDSAKDIPKIQEALDFLQQNFSLNRDITLDQIVTPNAEHQWYTHLGWEYDYTKELPIGWTNEMAQAQQKIFTLRKNILLDTVKNLFPNLSTEKQNSMAALNYYTHMAGDTRYNNSPNNIITIQELSENLQKHLKILFGNKANRLGKRINKNLKGVKFEDCAIPLDNVFSDLFNNVPQLIKTAGLGTVSFSTSLIKPILIISGIVLLIFLILLFLRNCDSSSNEKHAQTIKTIIIDTPSPVEPLLSSKIIFNERTEMLFIANSHDLLPSASEWLDGVADELLKYIEQNPNATFQVIGYIAVVPGTENPNILSLARANKVILELSARNINANKLQAISGGETNRWGNNIDELSRAPNRRIIIQVEK